MFKKEILRFLSLTLLFFSIVITGKPQDLLRNYDLSTLKVDKLSDADILKLKQQLDASGLTEQQAEQIAIAKGMPITEVQKLRARLQQVSASGSTSNQNN